MRHSAVCFLLIALLALAACSAPAPEPAAIPAPSPTSAAPPASSAPRLASPALLVAVLDDPASDSPFRWDPVESGPPRTRIDGDAMWAPVGPAIHALKPGSTVEIIEGSLRVDGVPLAVPTRFQSGDTWADVGALAKALDGYARRHPEDGSVTLWPAAALTWLRDNGDPRAPVLLEARAEGIIP